MANDPYAACICGSGKKLKFCCQDILADMQRIEQLRDNQPDVALQQLQELYVSHPDRDVLVIELSELSLELGKFEEARDLCVEFLRRHPDDPRVTLLVADLVRQERGFEESRRLVHRAIQLAQPAHYQHIAMLLASIADEMLRNGNPASAYAHLRLSIQFAPAELRSSLQMLLTTWTTRISEYFPLMGSLELMPVNVDAAHQEIEQKAQRLSEMGCWEPSSILYTRLIKEDPENAALWHNCGLFHLWDDQIGKAAACLHRAASLIEDVDAAIDVEALATLLDLEVSNDRIRTMQSSRVIERPREVSDRLSSHERFGRDSEESQLGSGESSQEYIRILADVPRDKDGGQLDLGAAIITANIDGAPDHHVVTVTSREDTLEEAWSLVLEAAGDAIASDAKVTQATVSSSVPECFVDFDWNVHFGGSLSAKQMRSALENRNKAALDAWLHRSQPQLNGLTPLEAAKKPELQMKLAASVLVLFSITQRLNHEINPAEIREQLGLPAPGGTSTETGQSIEGIPLLKYLRLSLSDLSDSQMLQFAHRIGLIRSIELMEAVVDELFRRPAALEEFSPRRAHMMRAMVARLQNRVDTMAESFEAARKMAQEEGDNFQARLELDLKELSYRLDDPDDPGIPHLLRSMKEQYFQKVPEIAEAIRQELTRTGCEQLLSELDAPLILTAGEETATPSSGKLWLPGQD
jgi:tetratricopeptide (TPR) repeat protein